MAEKWYGGWDSGINSEIPSAAPTKPPSCVGDDFARPPACQSVTYASHQTIYAQPQMMATSAVHEMEFSQSMPMPPQPMHHHHQQQQPHQMQMHEPQKPIEASLPAAGYGAHTPQRTIETPYTPTSKTFQASAQSVDSEENTTAAAIPKLIQLLRDEDPVVVSHAGVLVQQLSKGDRGRQVLISSQPMIEALVSTLSASKDAEVIRTITGTLHSLSQIKQGLRAICQYGGITSLIFVLQSAHCAVDQWTLHYALTMLHNALLQESEIGGVKQAARASQGAAVLTRLLSRDNPKFLAILADCLHFLCLGHSESKLAVVANGGPQNLVRIMRSFTYEKLLWAVSRLLKVLSTCQQNKTAIIEAGGMHALTAQLSQPSTRLVMNCLWSLRNLSDAATKQTGLDHLMHFLLQVLATIRDRDMVACAIGVLSNLTCNNQHNKIVICNNGGIEIIFRALAAFGDQQSDILEPGICTLRHLTSRHPASEQAQATFRSIGGVQFLSQLLSAPWASIRPPIVKVACGLVRNLALVDANHSVLLENGCVHRLADILIPAANELLMAAEKGISAPKSMDGTRLDDLAEQAAAALHAILRDPACRQAAKQMGVGQALIQLSSCQLVGETTRKQAAGALTELAAVNQTTQPVSSHQQMPSKPASSTTSASERLMPSSQPVLQSQPQSLHAPPQTHLQQQQQQYQPPSTPQQQVMFGMPPQSVSVSASQHPPMSVTPMMYQQQPQQQPQPSGGISHHAVSLQQQKPPQPQQQQPQQYQMQQPQQQYQMLHQPQQPQHMPPPMSAPQASVPMPVAVAPSTPSHPQMQPQQHVTQPQPSVPAEPPMAHMSQLPSSPYHAPSRSQPMSVPPPPVHQQPVMMQHSHQNSAPASWYQMSEQDYMQAAPQIPTIQQHHQQYSNQQYSASPQHYGY